MIIALVGAESTGKSTLAAALARHLAAHLSPGVRIRHVDEYLRTWCITHDRTPLASEQAAIAQEQDRRILQGLQPLSPSPLPALAVDSEWVVADTTGWVTAAYSEHYFGDTRLYATAEALHLSTQRPCLTLLMGLDVPWQPDAPLPDGSVPRPMRDGPAARDAVDTVLRQRLLAHGIGFQTVYGQGAAREASALRAVAAWLRQQGGWASQATDIEKIANNIHQYSGEAISGSKYRSVCECCGDPACERRLFSALRRQTPGRSPRS